jgi:hypothetical protein
MAIHIRRREFIVALGGAAAATTALAPPARANVPKPYSWDLSPPMPLLSAGCRRTAPRIRRCPQFSPRAVEAWTVWIDENTNRSSCRFHFMQNSSRFASSSEALDMFLGMNNYVREAKLGGHHGSRRLAA